MACSSGRMRRSASLRISPASSATRRKASSPRRRCRCRPARPSSPPASRPATSICVPSCSRARTRSASSRAVSPGSPSRTARSSSIRARGAEPRTPGYWMGRLVPPLPARGERPFGRADMLSRTADNLYWLSRYTERADFVARILDATLRLAALPASYGGERNEWEGAVAAAADLDEFRRLYSVVNEDTVRDFLAFSPNNPSSIASAIETARENARSVRTALTTEMWEAINGAWLELKRFDKTAMSPEEFGRFLDWAKGVSLAFDGSAYRTMLRNDAYWFTRLGLAIERADNTARILDVKFHLLLPETERVGGSLDYFQWTTILREVSALTAYHWVYRESVKPWLVADLLILNRQLPRSLANCYELLVRHLDLVADAYGRRGPSQRLASNTLAKLTGARIEGIFEAGLHEFINEFIEENNKLGVAIVEQYLV